MTQPEVNIGLIGHIDHGKTSILESLSGVWADKHSEEKRRGITIRLGYADSTFYKCGTCKPPACYSTAEKCPACGAKAKRLRSVSFVDAPGHETLMATMLSGAAIMDGAVLVIGANEPCPAPQTKEHLMALEVIGKKSIVVVQNKVDLVSKERAQQSYREIKSFLKGSIAESAPIIPVSALKHINIDALIMAIEGAIKTPKRDAKLAPRMFIARSFDINRPGAKPADLKGGVLGGALVEGKLKIGDEVEILPGRKVGEGKWEPVRTKIESLFSGSEPQKAIHPGGSVGVGTLLDPIMAKSDTLSGNVLGIAGKLPPTYSEIDLEVHLLDLVVGLEKEIKVEPIKPNEPLMLTVGSTTTVGIPSKGGKDIVHMRLKLPVCVQKGDRIVISRRVEQKWRLVGYGILK